MGKYSGIDLCLGTAADGEEVWWTSDQQDNRPHMYVSGASGSGKSRFLQSVLRQLCDANTRSRVGFLNICTQGELHDQLLAYISNRTELRRLRPIIIDARRDDWIVSYNILRQRAGVDLAVIAENFIEAFTHAFGGDAITATPLLARIGRMFVESLLHTGRSLVSALPLLLHGNAPAREALLAELPEGPAKDGFTQLHSLHPRDFDATLSSFLNRISAFVSNRFIATTIGQPPNVPTFDFDTAIEEGRPVLVCLATEGGRVSETNARLFGTLLASDLRQTAKLRGKKGAGEVKRFYAILDECHEHLSITTAKELDTARGFGLTYILANQASTQFFDYGGEFGQAIYRAVMVNTGVKVAFACAEQDELRRPIVEAIFGASVDVHKVETAITSVQTVGYEERMRILRGGGTATTHGESDTTGDAKALALGIAESIGDVEGDGETEGTSSTEGHTSGYGKASQRGHIDSAGVSIALGMDADGNPTTEIHGDTDGYAANTSESDSWNEADTTSDTYSSSRNRFRARTASTALQKSSSTTTSTARSKSTQHTENATWHEAIDRVPILEERPTQLVSVENQLFEFGQRLSAQARQHAHVRIPGQPKPIAFRSLECPEVPIARYRMEEKRVRYLEHTDCALLFSQALAQMEEARRAAVPDIDAQLLTTASPRKRLRVINNGDDTHA